MLHMHAAVVNPSHCSQTSEAESLCVMPVICLSCMYVHEPMDAAHNTYSRPAVKLLHGC